MIIMNVIIFIILAIGAVVVWKKLTKKSAPSYSRTNSDVQGSNDTLNKRTAFLEDIPSDSEEERTGISFKDTSCINYINKLSAEGKHADAIRWINKALSLNPPFDFEIVLRRNRCVALGELFGIGKSGARRDLDYCIAAEYVVQDFEAIIGLYVTNEDEIKGGNNMEIIDNSFQMALHNLIPIGLSNMAYQNADGSYGTYNSKLPQKWKVDFVGEPKNALRVNGNIYPQYTLPK
jgi:hypothetical protein